MRLARRKAGNHMPLKKGHNRAAKRRVSAKTLKVYKFAAAAAHKKVAAAELAFDSDPSAENTAAVQQARAKACAASAKQGRAGSAEEGGSKSGGGGAGQPWSQQKRARQSRTNGSVEASCHSTFSFAFLFLISSAHNPWLAPPIMHCQRVYRQLQLILLSPYLGPVQSTPYN